MGNEYATLLHRLGGRARGRGGGADRGQEAGTVNRVKSSEEVDFFDISIWRRSARLSPTTRRRATVLRDQRQLRGHPPELRHGTDTAHRRRRGERGGVHGERPVHGPTDHAQRLGVRNSSYVSSLASASLASRTRVNKEPTSELEPLYCSLRVIHHVLQTFAGV